MLRAWETRSYNNDLGPISLRAWVTHHPQGEMSLPDRVYVSAGTCSRAIPGAQGEVLGSIYLLTSLRCANQIGILGSMESATP